MYTYFFPQLLTIYTILQGLNVILDVLANKILRKERSKTALLQLYFIYKVKKKLDKILIYIQI